MNVWLYLGLSILSSLLVAQVLRESKQRNGNIPIVLAINYLIASLVSFQSSEFNQMSVLILSIAVITGIFFAINFFVFAHSVQKNGLGLSITAMRVSLIVPILGSVFLFKEQLSVWIGLGLALIAIVFHLMNPSKLDFLNQKSNSQSFVLLFSLFLISGFGDLSIKFYEEIGSGAMNSYGFMFVVFSVAFLVCLIAIVNQKNNSEVRPVLWKSMILGLLLGIPNLYSSIFMIKALSGLKAVIAFPLANISIILLGSFWGILYWKDIITRKQKFGIALALISIIILSIEP